MMDPELEKFALCPGCNRPLRNNPKDHDHRHDECSLCREYFCIEHGIDVRSPDHPAYCQSGEW
jgi:hypothetical protein